MLLIVLLHVIPPALFALLHGMRVFGVRGIVVFAALCLGVGNLFENAGILTGFPFGDYYFTDVMGPKILNVPVLLGLAYVGMGYLSWTLARLIVRNGHWLATQALASCLMVVWDLAMEPVWATIVHAWSWRKGGPYFGVPVSNFLGWYLTVFMFYLLFTMYLRRYPEESSKLPARFWTMAILFYAVSAAGNLLVIPPAGFVTTADATGRLWSVNSIRLASGVVSLAGMGGFALIAWFRLHFVCWNTDGNWQGALEREFHTRR